MEPMTRVKLTKVSDNPNALRTADVVGVTPKLPEVGKAFHVFADALEGGAFRYVTTSIVTAVRPDGTFDTLNSTYRVEAA